MVPACSQCIRVKAECPGYRNALDLMFRHQRPGYGRGADVRGTGVKGLRVIGNSSVALESGVVSNRVSYGIASPTRDMAFPIVIHYFCDHEASGVSFPHLENVAENSLMSIALSALGYALLSNTRRSRPEIIEGRRLYGER